MQNVVKMIHEEMIFRSENSSVPGVQQVTRGWFKWILNCP